MVGKGRGGGGVVGLIKGTTSLFQFFVVVVCLMLMKMNILHTKHTKEAKLMLRVNV